MKANRLTIPLKFSVNLMLLSACFVLASCGNDEVLSVNGRKYGSQLSLERSIRYLRNVKEQKHFTIIQRIDTTMLNLNRTATKLAFTLDQEIIDRAEFANYSETAYAMALIAARHRSVDVKEYVAVNPGISIPKERLITTDALTSITLETKAYTFDVTQRNAATLAAIEALPANAGLTVLIWHLRDFNLSNEDADNYFYSALSIVTPESVRRSDLPSLSESAIEIIESGVGDETPAVSDLSNVNQHYYGVLSTNVISSYFGDSAGSNLVYAMNEGVRSADQFAARGTVEILTGNTLAADRTATARHLYQIGAFHAKDRGVLVVSPSAVLSFNAYLQSRHDGIGYQAIIVSEKAALSVIRRRVTHSSYHVLEASSRLMVTVITTNAA